MSAKSSSKVSDIAVTCFFYWMTPLRLQTFPLINGSAMEVYVIDLKQQIQFSVEAVLY